MAPGRVARLEPGARFARWLASGHEDHAVVLYRQGPGRSIPERAKLALVAQAVGNRFFQELRTERKIGYVVFASPLSLRGVPGLALVVQSDTSPPEVLREEVEAFVERFDAALGGLSDEDFERHRRAVESALLEAETRLDERTERYWTEIRRERYEFDSRERFLGAVRALTREELLTAWREVVVAPETARGMVVAVSAGEPPDDAGPSAPRRAADRGRRRVQARAALLRRGVNAAVAPENGVRVSFSPSAVRTCWRLEERKTHSDPISNH